MEIDIENLVKEFKRYYPIDGMLNISTIGEEDPKAPEHEQNMHCLWVGLHRHNRIKLPKMFRGIKIFTEVINKVRMAI